MVIGFDAKRVFHNTSGLGNYSRDIIRILINQFPENKYLLYNPKPPNTKRMEEAGNIIVKYPESWLWKRFSSVWRQGPVSRQIRKDGVDIFHGLSNEIPRGIDKTKARVVVTIHDLIFIRHPEFYKAVDRNIYYHKFKYAAQNADVVIAISGQTKRDIAQYLNIHDDKIIVHYQGCHPSFKRSFADSEKLLLRKKLRLPDRYILTVGTIERRKNTMVLLKAVRNIPVHCVFVGRETSYKNELLDFINANDMRDRIHFIKNVEMNELAMIYQMADLFCYPSVFEGFGIPIIEALFSGTPVITTKSGCFSEAGGQNSLYLEPDDQDGWRSAIKEVLDNGELRVRMAEEGRKFVQKFNDENVGRTLMDIYTSLKH